MESGDEHKDYKYKFSIIMSIYNVEQYLRESIDSIINQTIGFEENVQLILVNDGSPDNSEEICLKYKEKYPNNIVYVKKENGGIASAKNCGLQYREGKYVNFFDPDDIISKNALKRVDDFFDVNENLISIVVIPLYFFEAQTGIHPKYKYMGNKNKIVNLDIEPHNFVLSSASAFYKTEIFDEISFDEEMACEEDTRVNFKIFEREHCFGYVCENKVRYNYRKRAEGGSIVDNSKKDIENYLSVIRLLDEVTEKERKSGEPIPRYKKELIIYETRSRFKSMTKDILEENYEYVVSSFKKFVSLVGEEYIATSSKWLPDVAGKIYYLREVLDGGEYFNISDNGFLRYKNINLTPINKFKVHIKNLYFTTEKICFDIFFWNYNMNNLKLIAKTPSGKVLKFSKEEEVDGPANIKYGEISVCNTIKIKIKLPYKRRQFKFYILDLNNGKEYKINDITINQYTRLMLKDKEIRAFYNDFNIKYKDAEISIKKFKYPTFKYNWNSYKRIKQIYKYKAKYRLFNSRNKKYILISDRPEKAGDNGEAIFKYINKSQKELAKYTYFVMDNKNNDYKRLKKYGKVVKLNSIKHKFLFLNARVIMSSHMHMPFYFAFDMKEKRFYRDMLEYKFVWLQHGITKDDISAAANKFAKGIDYVVLATNPEKEEFSQPKYFYDDKNLVLTGFPRFDYLRDHSKNIISIVPTWRSYLSGDIRNDGFHDVKAGFEDSDYFAKYSKILTDESFINRLRENNLKVKFCLHPGMAGYENSFKQYENDVIKIVGADKVNYSKVFAESKLLITDYSSVFFDFAYLKKPIIYYQFDREEFFGSHYKSGYFNYYTDAFGDIIEEDDELLQKINYYIDNGFKMEQEYIDRVENTFKYTDRNNCKRLIKYLEKRKVITK